GTHTFRQIVRRDRRANARRRLRFDRDRRHHVRRHLRRRLHADFGKSAKTFVKSRRKGVASQDGPRDSLPRRLWHFQSRYCRQPPRKTCDPTSVTTVLAPPTFFHPGPGIWEPTENRASVKAAVAVRTSAFADRAVLPRLLACGGGVMTRVGGAMTSVRRT